MKPRLNFRWLQFAWRNTLRNRRRSAVTVTIFCCLWHFR